MIGNIYINRLFVYRYNILYEINMLFIFIWNPTKNLLLRKIDKGIKKNLYIL